MERRASRHVLFDTLVHDARLSQSCAVSDSALSEKGEQSSSVLEAFLKIVLDTPTSKICLRAGREKIRNCRVQVWRQTVMMNHIVETSRKYFTTMES